MLSNLHRLPRAWAATVTLLTCPVAIVAQQRCPPLAQTLTEAGWKAYRSDSIAAALIRFGSADSLCQGNLDAMVGLGYVALRQDRVSSADSIFRLVVRADSSNADGWDGLTLSGWRRGDREAAARAARQAVRLRPSNASARNILLQIDPDWDRPATRRSARPAVLQVPARTRGERFEISQGSRGWQPFFVRGVNMGVALPGKFPSEFPVDSAVYAGWLDTIAAMPSNALRVYTILPPSFYRALRGWNLKHPASPLWLIHGVWTELPPEHDFNDSTWKADFQLEMRRVVDLLHGNERIPVRPGHAGGRYDADVSRWTLAYIIGREWEPYAVVEFDAQHPGSHDYRGRFLEARAAPAVDRWMAELCDYLLGYEVDRYNTIRPIAYTNWPTLDPMAHITESTGKEERAWRKQVGRPVPADPHEYENDAIGLDAMLIHPTARNPAGWFASFHAYPYYPDFMLHEPTYDTAQSSGGRSNYFGYLRELKRHHKGMPFMISEYGVPSSRGLAHLQPQGFNHGGHDERDMAHIDAQLSREIRESGAAGEVIFAWIDEWFKKNWIVIDYEIPLENTRQWHNVMDAEQNYGILGMYAGPEETTPLPGGEVKQWLALKPLDADPSAATGAPARLRVGQDASYLYVAMELSGMNGRAFPWDSFHVRLAIDSWKRDLGQTRLPDSPIAGDIGFEFLADFRSPEDAQLMITPDYNPFEGAAVIVGGDDFSRFARRPFGISRRDDGRFDSLFIITNRARFARDGAFFPASGYNRGRLRFGRAAQSTLSDWFYDQGEGLLELRLPWALLNVSDPSTVTLILGAAADAEIATTHAEGFRFGALTYREGDADPSRYTVGALPHFGNDGRWHAADFPNWTWTGWTEPQYHQRMKPVYDSLRALWGGK